MALQLLREMQGYGVRAGECLHFLRDPFTSQTRTFTLFATLITWNLDEISYNSVLHAMTKDSDPKWLVVAEDMLQEMKENRIPISRITYHVLMNIYGKSGDKNGAKKAEELLRGMEEESLSACDISYNICIDAYARRGDNMKAESLLEEMISLSNAGRVECQPSIHSFGSVVSCLLSRYSQ